MNAYPTAQAALDARYDAPGAKTITGSYAEAFKLAGQPTINVDGEQAWFSVPIRADFTNKVWNVCVSVRLDPVMEEIALIKEKFPERLDPSWVPN